KIIILRCHPKTLETRLKNKGYNPAKIQENLEAEAIDVITIESVELHGNNEVYEIDVTNKNANDVANDVLKIIKSEDSARNDYKLGKIDWSEEILEWY
ncbi:MAG: toxin, partial [Thermoplasmata archaeon]|nr:toxin [Thermoplasmata archaeon]